MSTRLDRLITLNANTDGLMEFRRVLPNGEVVDDDESMVSAPALATGAAAGVGGVLGHQAIQRAGGYGAMTPVRKVAAGLSAGKLGVARVGEAGGGLLQKIMRGLSSGVKAARYAYSSRTERIINLSAKADELLEFGTPLGDFKRDRIKLILNEGAAYSNAQSLTDKEAANKRYVTGLQDLQNRIHRESHVRKGFKIGAVAGAAGGAALGVLAGRKLKASKALLGAAGGIYGTAVGASVGTQIGGSIRRKTPLQ